MAKKQKTPIQAAKAVNVKMEKISPFTPLEKKLILGIENCLNTRYKDFIREFQDWDVAEYVILQAAKDLPDLNISFSEKSLFKLSF